MLQLEVGTVGCGAAGRIIQVPDGHPVQDRIRDVCSVPSGSTAKPGTPRLNTATVRARIAHRAGELVHDDLGVGKVLDDAATAASSPLPATTSTGRTRVPAGPRRAPKPPPTAKRAAPTPRRAVVYS